MEEKPFVVRDKRSSAQAQSAENPEERTTQAVEEASPDSSKPAESESSSDSPKNQPPITFSTFVLSLSSSAAMSMGGYQDPVSGHIPKNLEIAKQSIDILGIIQEKTKGNLTGDEEKLLDSALYELRMRYVEEVKKSG